MKISYAEYLKKTDASVLVAEAIFSELFSKFPLLKISDVADTTSGGTPLRSNAEYHNGTIPWLKSGELNDKWIEGAEEFITEEGLSNSSAKLLPEGTLLLAMYGATAGRTGITRIKAATNQAVCALFPNEKVTQEYLFWFLRQHRYYFIEISKGGAQPNISQSVIKGTLLPVPDKILQNQIANILSTIESTGKIDLNTVPYEFKEKVNKVLASKNNVLEITTELTHQLTLVKKIRQQLLHDAVQGKLVPQDKNDEPASVLLRKIKAGKRENDKKYKELPAIKPEEIPFDIPDNWFWCRMGDLAIHSEAGKSYQAIEIPAQGNEWGVIKTSAITSGVFLENENKKLPIQADYGNIEIALGDMIFCRASGSKSLAGKSCLVDYKPKARLILSDKSVRFIFPQMLSKKFIHAFTSSRFAETYYQSLGTGKSTSMNNITRDQFNNLLIPLPPAAEQYRIVAKLEELMETCDELEVSVKASTGQNENLLQQVLREALTDGTN